MATSVYKVIELIGTSPDSWEKAAAAAIGRAAESLRDLRVAEVSVLDMYRTRFLGHKFVSCGGPE